MGEIFVRRVGYDAGDYALVVVMEHTGHDAYDPTLATYMRPVYFLCIAVHEVLCAVARRALLSGDPLDRSKPQDALAWMLRYKGVADSILRDSGLAQKLADAKKPLRTLIPALAALRKQRSYAGLETRPRAPRTPGRLVPKSHEGRLQLAEEVLAHGREMALCAAPLNSLKLIPGDMVGDDEKYRRWVTGRRPGRDLSLAVMGYGGTTLEGVERAREIRRANSVKLKAKAGLFPESRFDLREGALYTKAEKSERKSVRRIVEELLAAFMTIKGLETLRQGNFDDVPRMGRCEQCDHLVLGSNSNSRHHCHDLKKSLKLNLKNFSTLTRVVCPDDLLTHPAVQELIAEESIPVTYEKVDVIDILQDADIQLPGVERIPPETGTWMAEEMDWDLQVYYAYQAALAYVTTGPSQYEPQHSRDINKILSKKEDSLYEHLAGVPSENRIFAGGCAHGYRGILVAPGNRRECARHWSHLCPKNNYAKTVYNCLPACEQVQTFLQLPSVAAQHVWYLYAIHNRRAGPNPLLFNTITV
ncbi:hypothetical protein EXIGLDRAFT_716822 [Exidia glandulosa HHB12029]|uniref:Uncharacterized protein n=1 Tax=Exidia glandulosa HHB12029 TaxID=1314781 RepID=A0A165IQ54_EXIGL|nr:hypothetical protein EXIGLDRAFT_716822 [Exidia glandulosa HHB12029]